MPSVGDYSNCFVSDKTVPLEIPTKCPHCKADMSSEERVTEDGSKDTYLYTVEVLGKPMYWHCWKCDGAWEIGKKNPVFWWECD